VIVPKRLNRAIFKLTLGKILPTTATKRFRARLSPRQGPYGARIDILLSMVVF
jgi:hypothetical protein